MEYYQIDSRPTEAARIVNEKIFSSSKDRIILGIEVTLPEWARRCRFGNLDHHGPETTVDTPSACEQALTQDLTWLCPHCGHDTTIGRCELCGFAREIVMVTVRPDADSVTAMAVITSRLEGREVDTDLVRRIGAFDRLGPVAERCDRVIAVARVATTHQISLEERVWWVQGLLAGGQTSEIAGLVEARNREYAEAEAASEINLVAGGRIATVVSTHRFATNLGYERATVVVAQNPAMPVDPRNPAAGTYNKFTVCRYDSHVPCDLPAALAELQELEPGWGGRGDIFGSPQGLSSERTLNQVVKVVAHNLK